MFCLPPTGQGGSQGNPRTSRASRLDGKRNEFDVRVHAKEGSWGKVKLSDECADLQGEPGKMGKDGRTGEPGERVSQLNRTYSRQQSATSVDAS